jgi:hypothetical protein
MSEQRRPRLEVPPNSDTIATRLAEYANVYTKVIGTFTVPITPKFAEGHRLNATEARALNWAHANRAGSVANSAVTRGKESKLSDAEKMAYLVKYMNEYKFTDELGGEFSSSLLESAVDRLIFERGKEQRSPGFSGDYADSDNKEGREFRAKLVGQVLTTPELADRYEPMVRAMVQTILNERHEVSTRTPKGTKAEAAMEL